ncbi:MAG: sigma-54 dependent transcriptional regulator [Candidatus Neomarinimicrobiota bacterium]|jgi:DNA-binding NtrC family response regulator|nr:sigma-54 dependent transcriptional regulator [Candidatus Neomarinimicrobiota bacterium]|tara:strand:- start:11622 stop:12851 length:1230 start_codon:yes stop_codon:yes gene_type:complete
MKIDIQRLQKQSGIIGTSEKIIEVLGMIAQVAPVDISVLITGESGTGKEVMARAIHKHSKRSNSLMVTVNCGAIPEGIIESELFGHKKGSFTGASENRKGYFEEANKGTIFLDEIGEAPLETQVKLLRVLETGEYMRVGESKVRYTDVRVLAATNKNLIELVKKNQFRQDLYYRLKTVMVQVPPLRDRVEDINPLVERFALEFTRSNEISYRGFMPDAIRIMKQYNWPGNIRELKNFVEMIMVFEKGERITVDMVNRELNDVLSDSVPDNYHLPIAVNSSSQQAEIDIILRQLFLLRQDTELIRNLLAVDKDNNVLRVKPIVSNDNVQIISSIPDSTMEVTEDGQPLIRDDAIGEIRMKDLEKEAITRTLRYFNNNRRKTARSLGVSERTLYRKIEDYNLEPKIKRNNG